MMGRKSSQPVDVEEKIRTAMEQIMGDAELNPTARVAASNVLKKLRKSSDGQGLGSMTRAKIHAELEACAAQLGRKSL